MADNLIFPIKFDLEKAVQQAMGDADSALRKLETHVRSRPLAIELNIGNAGSGSIDEINKRIKELTKEWNALSEAQRITAQGSKEYTAEARGLLAEYGELVSALETNARTLSSIWNANKRAVAEQERALQKAADEQQRFEQQMREAENRRYNEASRNKLKEQADDEKRYQRWLANKEKEVQKEQEAALKRRQAQDKVNEANSKAAIRTVRNDEAVYYTNRALRAQEDIISNLNAKLQIYQQHIAKQQVGSDAWNRAAIEIRRITEELQKANQQMQDFQQKSFAGLSDRLATSRVQALTRYREELTRLDRQFNRLNATGAAYNTDGSLTASANDTLKRRQQITLEINKMLKTAADAQLQREQEINRVIEQRKAKQDAIVAKRKAEQAAIQANIAKLKEERRVLTQQENSVANITAKLQIQQQRLNSANLNSKEFQKIAAEVERLSKKLEQANAKVREMTGQKGKLGELTNEYGKQSSYLERLAKRMVLYASVHQVGNFVSKVREVTAQFELQRISLGAIIQDQARANLLFSEIKNFALKSPVTILDLTKYTKQLAAYKIGVDDLFETTKKLTDVSVGLGVSMDRVVLAYGQTRATGYLRASEIRQFTEMGVPIVEELATKLSKMNGELVTAADVMDLVSKRGISFELVKEVFDDMTSAGGIFYNMQEKQGNTLYGMWAKLGDAASMMYDQIGNASLVNGVMKELINTARQMMINWKASATQLATVAIALLLYKNRTVLANIANNQGVGVLRKKIHNLKIESQRLATCSSATTVATRAVRVYTWAQLRCAQAANLVVAGFKALRAALASNIFGIVLVGISLLIEHLILAKDEAEELQNALATNNAEYTKKQRQDAANLAALADAAVNAAKGSKKQKEALDELQNTYGKIIPMEMLTIENLERMKGNYSDLIDLVAEYNLTQKRDKDLSAINDSFSSDETERANIIRNELKNGVSWRYGNSAKGKEVSLSEAQIERFMSNLIKYADEGYGKVEIIRKASADLAKELSLDATDTRKLSDALISLDKHFYESQGTLMDYTETLHQHHVAEEVANEDYQKGREELTKYAEIVDAVSAAVMSAREISIFDDEFNNELTRTNTQIANIATGLNELFEKAGLGVGEAGTSLSSVMDGGANSVTTYTSALGNTLAKATSTAQKAAEDITLSVNQIPEATWEALEKAATAANNPKLLAAIQNLRKQYREIAPDDQTVAFVRTGLIKIVSAADEQMQMYRQYLYDGKKDIKEHQKDLKESIAELKTQAFQMTKVNALIESGLASGQKWDEETIKELQTKADTLQQYLEDYINPLVPSQDENRDSGHRSDPRLQNLKEEASLVQKLYNEYKQLKKQEGEYKAGNDMHNMADKTIDEFSKKYGIGLPRTANDVVKVLSQIYNKMSKLPKSVFPALEKELRELQWTAEHVGIDGLQESIEKELDNIAERISKSKTAKDFFDKILSQTGDIDLASRVTTSIYNTDGGRLFEEQVKQIREVFLENANYGDVELTFKARKELAGSIDTENQRIDFARLATLYDEVCKHMGESNRKLAADIVKNGQKQAAENVTTWEKELAKSKSYEAQRTDIINRETARRAEIYKSNIPQEDKDRLAEQSQKKQDEDLAKVDYEEFTNSESYIRIFENLENSATSSLKRLRAEMQALIDTNHNLSPENMKALVKATESIDTEINGRGFGNGMVKGVRDYIAACKEAKRARTALEAAEAEYQAQEPQLNADIQAAKDEEVAAEQALLALKQSELATDQQIVEAELRLNTAKAAAVQAENKKAAAAKKVEDAEEDSAEAADDQEEATKTFFKDLDQCAKVLNNMASLLSETKGLLDLSSESTAGIVFDAAIQGLQTMATLMSIVTTAQLVYNAVTESNPWMAIAAAVLAVIAALSFGLGAAKVARANKEIERQQDLLDNLEYTYKQLEKLSDKLFGNEYISNYNQQISNLQKQQEAYLKQAEAERSKGKKEDEEKTKEYLENARDAADKIKELQEELAEHFTGSSKGDMARQMAESWLEARASMSDTFTAIQNDYKEMIRNMIVEGAAAKVIENALTPMWEAMDERLKEGDVEAAIEEMVNGMDSALTAADNGMEVLWQKLEQKGFDLKELLTEDDGEHSGIAKSVAGATSEEINNVAAIGNTLMYYVSPIPRIDENLARVVALMEGGGTGLGSTTGAVGWTDWQRQAMDNYTAIQRNTADTVVECRRAAEACEKITRLIKTKGSTSGLNVFLNS